MPRGAAAEAIRAVNASGAWVVSADINSGMNGDTGEAVLAVRSDLTVSIGFYKTGLFLGRAGVDRRTGERGDRDRTGAG